MLSSQARSSSRLEDCARPRASVTSFWLSGESRNEELLEKRRMTECIKAKKTVGSVLYWIHRFSIRTCS